MAKNISNEDLSFQDLFVDYGAHIKRSRTEYSDGSSTRTNKGKSKNRSTFSDSSSKSNSEAQLVQMVTKIYLRQKDMLNAMTLNRNFLFFLQADKESILPTMFIASKEWHTEKLQARITYPLRQILLLKIIEELVQRISRFNPKNNEDVFYINLKAKQILTEQNA